MKKPDIALKIYERGLTKVKVEAGGDNDRTVDSQETAFNIQY
jgi:hypothetical protein